MISSNYSTMNDALLRKIEGKVALYNGAALLETFLPSANDKKHSIQEITVSRVGEKGKFFGYGICQQATVKIVDNAGDLSFLKGNKLQTSFRANSTSAYTRVCPSFYVKDAIRDEKTSVITVTSYDALDGSISHLIGELELVAPYTIKHVVERISGVLGLSVDIKDPAFDTVYENGANFGNDETFRAVLNSIAEATQTIYYVDHRDCLVFKRLSQTATPVLTVNKRDYFELNTGLPVTLTKIVSATELGENHFAGDDTGITQYVRENPFWNNRSDIGELLQASINRISGLTVVPFTLKWRGNFLTEIGDKIKVETKEAGKYIDTYILEDSFTYNGGFSQKSDWEYNPDTDRTTAANPITIGEKINQTFARVDKIEKNITLYVSDIVNEVLPTKIDDAIETITDDLNKAIEDVEKALGDDIADVEENLGKELDDMNTAFGKDISDLKATTSKHTENISQLQLTSTSITSEVNSLKETTTTITDELENVVATQETIQNDVSSLKLTSGQISASVSSVEQTVTKLSDDLDDVSDQANGRIDKIASEVALKLDKNAVEITVDRRIEEGVDKVTTASKKYTFDDEGLNISANDSGLNTVVTENGMRIYESSKEVLTANNEGVKAADLHAYTFLIIGENSRMEDRGNRTACFWIGKAGG